MQLEINVVQCMQEMRPEKEYYYYQTINGCIFNVNDTIIQPNYWNCPFLRFPSVVDYVAALFLT